MEMFENLSTGVLLFDLDPVVGNDRGPRRLRGFRLLVILQNFHQESRRPESKFVLVHLKKKLEAVVLSGHEPLSNRIRKKCSTNLLTNILGAYFT